MKTSFCLYRKPYYKNIGREVVIVTTEGERLAGTLSAVEDDLIVLKPLPVRKKTKNPIEEEPEKVSFAHIKETKVQIKF